jgi:hypothetical protein
MHSHEQVDVQAVRLQGISTENPFPEVVNDVISVALLCVTDTRDTAERTGVEFPVP